MQYLTGNVVTFPQAHFDFIIFFQVFGPFTLKLTNLRGTYVPKIKKVKIHPPCRGGRDNSPIWNSQRWQMVSPRHKKGFKICEFFQIHLVDADKKNWLIVLNFISSNFFFYWVYVYVDYKHFTFALKESLNTVYFGR